MTVRYTYTYGDQTVKTQDYQPPRPDQIERMERARGRVADLMWCFDEMAPTSRELSLAMTKLDEALFWFNSAVIRNEMTGPTTEATHLR